jgi:hypothetical protein
MVAFFYDQNGSPLYDLVAYMTTSMVSQNTSPILDYIVTRIIGLYVDVDVAYVMRRMEALYIAPIVAYTYNKENDSQLCILYSGQYEN